MTAGQRINGGQMSRAQGAAIEPVLAATLVHIDFMPHCA
jgi:hypothetical protein